MKLIWLLKEDFDFVYYFKINFLLTLHFNYCLAISGCNFNRSLLCCNLIACFHAPCHHPWAEWVQLKWTFWIQQMSLIISSDCLSLAYGWDSPNCFNWFWHCSRCACRHKNFACRWFAFSPAYISISASFHSLSVSEAFAIQFSCSLSLHSFWVILLMNPSNRGSDRTLNWLLQWDCLVTD